MNWKEEVTGKLHKYAIMASAAESIPLELKNLEQEACSLQSAQAGASANRSVRAYENRLMNLVVKRQELEDQLILIENWLEFMNRALQKLPEWEKKVLELLYIQRLSASQVCMDLGM